MIKILYLVPVFLIFSCRQKTDALKPEKGSITESIYASGVIKSEDQYQAYAPVSGIVDMVFVKEGDTVKSGDAILSVVNDIQNLMQENARLNAQFADYESNRIRLDEAAQLVNLALSKMRNDSALYARQKALWDRQVGTKIELEQRELGYQQAKTAFVSAKVKYEDLKKQLTLNANVSRKNLEISERTASDFVLKSKMDGIVYGIFKTKGEMIGPQVPVAVIGKADQFVLEMQIDEYDILKIKKGQKVLVNLDSYGKKVFEAKVRHINPLMNERSKTFLVEATFDKAPPKLYPNLTFEANIVLRKKDNTLLVPRNYLLNDSFLIKPSGDKVKVVTGLMDYEKAEILEGVTTADEFIKPVR